MGENGKKVGRATRRREMGRSKLKATLPGIESNGMNRQEKEIETHVVCVQ